MSATKEIILEEIEKLQKQKKVLLENNEQVDEIQKKLLELQMKFFNLIKNRNILSE